MGDQEAGEPAAWPSLRFSKLYFLIIFFLLFTVIFGLCFFKDFYPREEGKRNTSPQPCVTLGQ